MKLDLRSKISEYSNYLEIYIALLILVGIAVLSIKLFTGLYEIIFGISNDSSQLLFTKFLGDALKLVIGVEFVKMLVKHTPESVIEVLMFAIARKLIVESSSSFDIISGVISISILFLIRRYFYLDQGKNTLD